ncbi:MAG TPA: aldo/keto reductase [Clostridiales bacterium]|nr:aldo/keto reductase [Clostridiales bacterium]
MYYVDFDNLGFKVSRFGMGCMRLPMIEGHTDDSQVDEKAAIDMIRYAIDHGVNYIDTAYPYHGGRSEVIVGKALKKGYRDKTMVATKLPIWLAKKYEDFEKLLDEQLSRLKVDYIDFYLLHALDEKRWHRVRELGVLDFLEKTVQKGKIRYPGFSFHDELPVFKDILDSYDWRMCQIQLNILDEHYQAGVEGLKYAGSKGIPVVIMEPLKGGKLAQNLSQEIIDIWNDFPIKRSPVEWAFRWLYNFPEVTTILSGVSTMEQLKENIKIFENAKPNVMTPEELALVKRVQEYYKGKIKVDCTGCNYCMPCPSNVAIPDIFSMYNNASIFDDFKTYKKRYEEFIKKGKDGSQCVECGNCESVCPQHLPIIEKIKEAHRALT